MKVIFYDKERETFERVEGVCQFSKDYRKKGGRVCLVWIVHTEGEWKTYPCKRYELDHVYA